MASSNVTVTLATSNVAVSSDQTNVTVSSSLSNVTVSNTAIITNSQIRSVISNTLPITYNVSTGVIGFDSNLDNLTLKKYQETTISNGNQSGDVSYNITNGTIHKATLTGDITGITLSSISTGGSATIILTQDAIGGHSLDLTTTPSNWTSWEFVDDYTTLSGTASTGIDIITVTYDGSKYYASVVNFQNVAPSTLTVSGNITSTSGKFIGDGSLLTNLPNQPDAVTSVNTQTGAVVLETNDIAENTNLYYTQARFDSAFGAKSTSDLSEGTNLYYTSARTDTDIADYTGGMTNATGNITTTANVSGAYILGDGSQLTNMPQTLTNAQVISHIATVPLSVGGNLSVTGNIDATGNINYQNVTDLYVTDQKITLNANATTDATVEIISNRPQSTHDAKIVWNEPSETWTFMNGDNVYQDILTTSQTRGLVSVTSATASGDGSLAYNNSTGVFTHTPADVPTSTSELTEGTNLYYTDARFDTRLGTKTTTNLTEGTNLYYTDARADARVDAGFTAKSTSDLSEGTNLYFTDARARGNISVGTPASASSGGALAYNSGTGVFTFTPADIQTDAEVRGLLSTTTASASGGGSLAYDNSSGVFTFAPAVPGIALTDLSITTASASGSGALAYDNTSGVFTFTPPVIGTGAVTSVNGATGVVVLDTADISEDTNLYYTDARSRAAVSTTNASASGGGALAYNNSTGVFTFTPSVPGIALTDISTTTTSASGGGALAYDNSSGVFTFTPADTTAGSISITDDTSTNATIYPTFASATSGSLSGVKVSSSKLSFNASTGVLQTDHISSASAQPLQLKGQTDGIELDKTIATVDSRIFDADTSGYSIADFDFHTATVTTADIPRILTVFYGTAGSNTVTCLGLASGSGIYIGLETAGGAFTSTGYLAGDSSLENALTNAGTTLGGISWAGLANLSGWRIFDVTTNSSTYLTSVTGHITGISGNTVTLSENLLQNIAGAVILIPGAYSSTQNIGTVMTGDTSTNALTFDFAQATYNQYDLPETLSNVTLDRVSYGASTVDMANVKMRHVADVTTGGDSALSTSRALLIGANVTPDLLSIGTNEALPATTALGISVEQDGLTDFGGVDTKPQMKFMMNNYKTNSLASETTYPNWTTFLGQSGNATVDMKYIGAPNFNFKLLGGTKTAKATTSAGDIPGRITWNTLSGSGSAGSDQFNPPASITAMVGGTGDLTGMANIDMYFQSTSPLNFRDGSTTASSIPNTFLSSQIGTTTLAAPTIGKVVLAPTRDYGDNATGDTYVNNRYANELHTYHNYLSAHWLDSTNKVGTLVEIQPKSGSTNGTTTGFNYDSAGDSTLRLNSHHSNSAVKAAFDITNDQSASNLVITQSTGATGPGDTTILQGNMTDGIDLYGVKLIKPTSVDNYAFGDLTLDTSATTKRVKIGTGALQLQQYTTTEINAISTPAKGDMYYNTTLELIVFYNGTGWRKINDAAM